MTLSRPLLRGGADPSEACKVVSTKPSLNRLLVHRRTNSGRFRHDLRIRGCRDCRRKRSLPGYRALVGPKLQLDGERAASLVGSQADEAAKVLCTHSSHHPQLMRHQSCSHCFGILMRFGDLCFAKTVAGPFFGARRGSPSGRLSPRKIQPPARHQGARTAVCGQDLSAASSEDGWNCGVGAEILQHRTTATTPRASRTGGEDRRLPGSRSPSPSLAAARNEAPARPCPTPSASLLRDSSSGSATQFASGHTRRFLAMRRLH